MFPIITVFQFPPNESFKIRVNFESLYGIYTLYPLIIQSFNEFMQFPNVNKDLFIFAP